MRHHAFDYDPVESHAVSIARDMVCFVAGVVMGLITAPLFYSMLLH